MKKRRLLAAFLATACAASLSTSAFAVDIPDDISDDAKQAIQEAIDGGKGDLITDGGTVGGVEVDAEVQKPTIAVVLPKKVGVFVNPYRAEVAIGTDETSGDPIMSIDTVVSPEMTVVNGSNCAIKINVKGQFVTYKYVDTEPDTTYTDAGTYTDKTNIKITGWNTIPGLTEEKLYADTSTTTPHYYVKMKSGVEADGTTPTYHYREVTAKLTPGKDATATAALVPTTYAISGYVATANIKVATAAVKEDSDKTNSIFMYVEGTDTSGKYPAAYNKVVAGVDAKGNVNVGGQYALAAKEGQGPVLYLGGNGTTGYMRVTGSSATAPTKTWTEVQETEGFETPFVFIVDPVANAAENPEIKTLTVTGGTLKTALATGKYAYDVTVPSGTTSVVLNVTTDTGYTVTKGVADGTVVKTVAYSTGKVTLTVDAAAAVAAKGTATFTVTSAHGKVNTYTINASIVAAP